MRIHVVHAALRVVFGNHNHHVFPIRRTRQKLHHPTHGQVVVGHVAFSERKPGLGAFAGSVVVGQHQREYLRHGFAFAHEPLVEFLHENIGPELVGNRHVVGREPPRSFAVHRRGS
ncbi:MAG: hypothetical protein MUD08_14135, partial [Cytophagales bacterium]|nr:hypothetical protein [Cytophagales bacterium]